MALQIGDSAPPFELKNQEGLPVNINDFLGSKALVIYFYPKNFTPGCTAQACSFRDQYQDFKDAGALVLGISTDNVASHKRFQQKHKLPFDTLSDPGGKVRKKYGVKSELLGLLPGRETFVISKKGIIEMRFNSMLAAKHIPKALKIVREL